MVSRKMFLDPTQCSNGGEVHGILLLVGSDSFELVLEYMFTSQANQETSTHTAVSHVQCWCWCITRLANSSSFEPESSPDSRLIQTLNQRLPTGGPGGAVRCMGGALRFDKNAKKMNNREKKNFKKL